MSLIEKMAKRAGHDLSVVRTSSKLGKLLRRHGVRTSSEFERVSALPRREDQEDRIEQLRAGLTELLKTPAGTMELLPIQALALEQIHDFGGLLGPIRVGGGKTLITLLAAEILEVERPLLMVPAKLRRKTRMDIAQLQQHWGFKAPQILSYEMLSHVDHADDLKVLKPDLLILDEAHKLKNKRAAVTRRVARYMKAHPKTHVVAMSGTIKSKSLRDYAHLAQWALGDHLSPLPTVWGVLEEWADALDPHVPENRRLTAGVLSEWMNPAEQEEARTDELAAVRKTYSRRLVQTPGVVATGDTQVSCSLSIESFEPRYSSATEEAFRHMHTHWETPDGWPIPDAATFARHARELACDFYYIWDPRPPDEWLELRAQWCKMCRDILKHNNLELDTELQLVRAIDQGHVTRGARELAEWRAIKDTFVPNTVPRWVDRGIVELTGRWLDQTGGIAWVGHPVVGEAIEDECGYLYYGRKSRTRSGLIIEQAKGPIVASIKANSEGQNLQDRWSQNWVTFCPSSGEIWEQLLGRTHRDGQEADEVSFTVLCGCLQAWVAFENARIEAVSMQDELGQNQKLNYADITWPTPSEVAGKVSPRWQSAT